MQEIQIFNNPDFGEIRTITINGEPWFVGNDCAKALGFKDPYSGVRKNVDAEDKLTCPVGSGGETRNMNVINESGLYSLIFGSKLESAKKFKSWVTKEVLPSIRKTGGYSAPKTIPEQIQLLAQGNVEVNKRIDIIEERFNDFEKSLPLLPNEADKVSNAVKKRVVEILGGKESPAYKNRGICQKAFKDAYRELKRNFDVTRYKDIKREQMETAVELALRYEPSLYLKESIEQVNAQQKLDI